MGDDIGLGLLSFIITVKSTVEWAWNCLLYTSTRIIDFQMFSILLLDPGGTLLQHRFSLRFNESVKLKHEIPLGVGLVGYAAQHKQAVLVPDVSKDPRYILSLIHI